MEGIFDLELPALSDFPPSKEDFSNYIGCLMVISQFLIPSSNQPTASKNNLFVSSKISSICCRSNNWCECFSNLSDSKQTNCQSTSPDAISGSLNSKKMTLRNR